MHHTQRLAILSATISLIAAPAVAAPHVAAHVTPQFLVSVQGHRSGPGFSPGFGPGLPNIGGGIWGGGLGFGGGRYNSWPSAPPPPPPAPVQSYQPPPSYQQPSYQPAYNTYQPPQHPQPSVAAAAPRPERTTVRKTTFAHPVPNAQPNYLATLSGVKGDDVSVRPAGGKFLNVTSGRQLKAADEVSSGPETEVTLTLRDGGTVRLDPATKVELAALDNEPKNGKPLVDLEIGELASKVSLGASTGYNLGIKTERATVMVREAGFTVRHDKRSGVTTVSVQEGVVRVTPANGSLQALSLQSGQQAEIGPDHVDTTTIAAADAAPATTAVADVPATADTAAAAAPTPGPAAVIPVSASAPAAAKAAAAEPTPAAGDLTGKWLAQDGAVVQLTQNGNQISWSYRGAAGHEGRAGTVSGRFDGKFLVGTFHERDGDTVGDGTITLTMDGGNRLVGGWISTSQPGLTGETVLTRQ